MEAPETEVAIGGGFACPGFVLGMDVCGVLTTVVSPESG